MKHTDSWITIKQYHFCSACILFFLQYLYLLLLVLSNAVPCDPPIWFCVILQYNDFFNCYYCWFLQEYLLLQSYHITDLSSGWKDWFNQIKLYDLLYFSYTLKIRNSSHYSSHCSARVLISSPWIGDFDIHPYNFIWLYGSAGTN